MYDHEIVILYVMSKKLETLKFFGFTKKVVHRGIEIEVAINDEVQDADKIPCDFCSKKLKTKQALVVHLKCVHLVKNVYVNLQCDNRKFFFSRIR